MTTDNQLIPATMMNGSAVSTVFAGRQADSLGEGIRAGFGIIGYRGKVWHTKYQGNETIMMRDDGDGPRNSIEVVIVKASSNISKIWYENGFVEGSSAAPDCFSTDGVKPDGGANKKQASACAACPKNAWGSKVTEAGKPGKACGDSKRLAVVPLGDIDNERMGGPMLLRVPAASLKDLKGYGDTLQQYGFPYFAVATRIAFDVAEAYPKFVFSAIRPLTDVEARKIIGLQDGTLVGNILNTSVEIAQHEPVAEPAKVPASPFEQVNPSASLPATVQPTAQAQAQAQPVAVAPIPAAAPADAGEKRKRRTKAEMEAAAAELAAKKSGAATPAAVTPQVTQPVAAPVAVSEELADDNFEDQLDALMPK
jgi:hypothetical protein